MLYFLLICINIILVVSLFSWKHQISQMSRQLRENRKIRITLSNRHIEELAGLINEKNNLEKKLQNQILQDEEQLKQSISDISHDLRTPLTSIRGYLTLLQNSKNPEEQRKYFSVIQSKADYLTDLVQSFYDLSVIENENYIMEIQKLDINKLVTDCLIGKYNELQGIDPIVKTENEPVWIWGNLTACKRIIENLIVNAIRYTDGYIELEINKDGIFTIKNSTSELDGIADTDMLFQKFYTADRSRSKGNTGLGLYIVKELLAKVNGGIRGVDYSQNILSISVYFEIYSFNSTPDDI